MNEIEKAQQNSQDALLSASKIIFKASEAINKAFKDVRFASEELEARLSELSKPVEREYRAGEWVPEIRCTYFYKNEEGFIDELLNCNDPIDKENFCTGNVYPTRAITGAAKAHAEWWREFDMIDEGGDFYICVNRDSDIRVCECDRIADGTPRYKNEMSARAAIERLGGEQKVIEMLNKGRVFRFKWGGQ